MTAVLQVMARGTGSIAASNTGYSAVGMTEASPLGTETQVQRTIRTAGVVSTVSLLVTSNDRGTSTQTFRVGAADAGSISISITASTTGLFQDLTHSLTLAAGDLVNTKLVTGAGGTTFVAPLGSFLFAPTAGGVVTLWGGTQGNNLTADSTTVYMPVAGLITETATEALVQTQMKVAGTWRNFAANVRTNSRGTTTNVKSRIGGVDGTQVVAVGAAVTGQVEDLTHSDALVADNLANAAITTSTGGGTFRLWFLASEFATTATIQCVTASGNPTTLAASASIYRSIGGSTQLAASASATESLMAATLLAPCTASMLQVNVATNTVVGASSVQFRKNAGNATQVVSITGLTTGWFRDLTNSDVLLATDTVDYLVTAGVAGTSMGVGVLTMLLTYPFAYGDDAFAPFVGAEDRAVVSVW